MIHLKRSVAALAATSLTAVGLAVVAVAPAQAAAAAPGVLTWEVSQYFDEHLSTHVLAEGATEDETGVVTFPGGVGSYDAATGATEVAYDGSIAGSFAMMGTTYYTVTLADPVVSVDTEGQGTLTAEVSAENAAAMGNPAQSTTPARVVLTTFDGEAATWTEGDGLDTLTATPRWAGVLAPNGAESTELGIKADKPVDGQAFSASFLRQLTPGVRALFYASGSASDAKKAPATFSAQVAPRSPEVVVRTTGASYADGLDLAVTGAGFTPVTNPGDNGVYLGLAEAGELPDTSQMDVDQFAAVAWVPSSAFTGGSFAAALNAPTAKLDPSLDYSVYTWQAHTHSTTTQDTETPVVIDFSALKQPSTPAKRNAAVAATWLKKPTTVRAGRIKVSVRGAAATPSGRITVRLVKQGKTRKTRVKALRAGAATVVLPRLVPGAWRVRISYHGSAAYKATTKTMRLTIRKKR